MRRAPAVLGLLAVLAAAPGWAQDVPKAELSGAYSYLATDPGRHGWNFGLGFSLTRSLSIVGELGQNYGSGSADDLTTFLGGVRYARRGQTITPFVHGLAGGARFSFSLEGVGVTITESQTDFAWLAGGGVDFEVAQTLAIRAQADYLAVSSEGETEGDLRILAGVVWRLGQK